MAVTFSRRIDFPMVDLAGIVYYPVFWDLAHRFFELHGEGTLVVKTKRKCDAPDGQGGVAK